MNEQQTPVAVAIDGPSGAGKSTIAKILAERMGYLYVDTGALYRAIGYTMLQRGITPSDAAAVEGQLPSLTMELKHVDKVQRVFVNGEDVSDLIRTPEVSMAASGVSAIPAVRHFLFDLQQSLSHKYHVIMDGRDIGTVVLPHAKVKVFLTASPEERARRRFEELQQKGINVTYEEVLSDIIKRDYDDSHRAAAPLKAADDAILVDTTGHTLEQAVEVLQQIIESSLES